MTTSQTLLPLYEHSQDAHALHKDPYLVCLLLHPFANCERLRRFESGGRQRPPPPTHAVTELAKSKYKVNFSYLGMEVWHRKFFNFKTTTAVHGEIEGRLAGGELNSNWKKDRNDLGRIFETRLDTFRVTRRQHLQAQRENETGMATLFLQRPDAKNRTPEPPEPPEPR